MERSVQIRLFDYSGKDQENGSAENPTIDIIVRGRFSPFQGFFIINHINLGVII